MIAIVFVKYDNAASGDHVSIVADDLGLPTDTESREDLLHDLEMAVEAVLAEHGLDVSLLKVISGHTYASIEADCPQCGDRLKLTEPALDATNGASATASCDCGWYGDATYRLIDLHDQSESSDDSEAGIFEVNSSVRQGDVRPQYSPY